MAAAARRALHYVLKIGDRASSISFLTDVLGMKVQRHEEFEKGCEATCNGPYDGKWSKTMIGYGSEDETFVLELTYNYGIGEYRHGNDLVAIEVLKKDLSKLKESGLKLTLLEGTEEEPKAYNVVNNGYTFKIVKDQKGDQISSVILRATDLARTLGFYKQELEMTESDGGLFFSDDQCKVKFVGVPDGEKFDRGQAFGRTAYACPANQLEKIQEAVKQSKFGASIQTELVTLPTPGKADVQVVIVADPDNHEICFVGDEGFRDLSAFDPNGAQALATAIAEDKSNEWFEKKGKSKGKQE